MTKQQNNTKNRNLNQGQLHNSNERDFMKKIVVFIAAVIVFAVLSAASEAAPVSTEATEKTAIVSKSITAKAATIVCRNGQCDQITTRPDARKPVVRCDDGTCRSKKHRSNQAVLRTFRAFWRRW